MPAATLFQRLAHFPVNPVARQEGAQHLVVRAFVGHAQQIVHVQLAIGCKGCGSHSLRRQAPGAKKAGVQAALHRNGIGGVVAEHAQHVVIRRFGPQQGQPTGVILQVMAVLNHVKLEGRFRQRPIRQSL